MLEEERTQVDSPVRRSRQTTAAAVPVALGIRVRRYEVQLKLKQGDVDQFEDANDVVTVGHIQDFRFNTVQFLSMRVFLFVEAKDVRVSEEFGPLNKEKYFTSYQEPIQLASVLDKGTVVSKNGFDQEVNDISTLYDIFVSRRASTVDRNMKLSPEFNFNDMLKRERTGVHAVSLSWDECT